MRGWKKRGRGYVLLTTCCNMKKVKSISDWVRSTDPSLTDSPPPVSSASGVINRKRNTLRKHPSTSKRKKATPLTKKGSVSNILPSEGGDYETWAIKYSPKSINDLAVHRKKIDEVQQWLKVALSHDTTSAILLITGPAGCGKTATVRAISHDMSISILEWFNPIDMSPVGITDRSTTGYQFDEFYESQYKQFSNFLLRGNKYPSLQFLSSSQGNVKQDKGKKSKIVLIEDMPNAILRDPSQLHHLLRSMKTFQYPLLFIVSDTQSSVGATCHLFPPNITSEFNIKTISFNPIAHTNMVKALQRIAESEHIRSSSSSMHDLATKASLTHIPNKEVIEAISERSSGDIRCAINWLQFACLKRGVIKEREGESKGTLLDSTSSGLGGRDCPMFLFRALGKILYCKRSSETEPIPLPLHLSNHSRNKLSVEPETIIESVSISNDLLTLYLHQNYLNFFERIEDVADAIECLSDSDVLSSVWTDSQSERRSLESCSSSVSVRGLLYANTEVSSSKWRPLHKPQWKDVYKKYTVNCSTARSLFLHLSASPHSHLWLPIELQTEILPFTALVNKPLRNYDQASILQVVTDFRTKYNRKYSKLGETEQGEDYEEGSSNTILSSSHDMKEKREERLSQTVNTTHEEYDDIEEFDDIS